MFRGIHVKYPLLLSDFSELGIFSTGFSKCSQISNFLKIPPVEPEIFLAKGQTDISKLTVVLIIVRFCFNYCQISEVFM
jgi:hypothetical protein